MKENFFRKMQNGFFFAFKKPIARFAKNSAGFGAIEAALTLPIFIGITMAVIDYGLLFTKQIAATAITSSIVRSIQENPSLTRDQLDAIITSANNSLVDFNTTGNCFSTEIFDISAQAAANAFAADKTCNFNVRGVTNAATTTPYLIATRGNITYTFITPINSIFTSGTNQKTIHFGQVVTVGLTNCPAGQALTSTGTCAATTTTCPANEFLTSSNTCSKLCPAGEFLTRLGTCAPDFVCPAGEFISSSTGDCVTSEPPVTAGCHWVQYTFNVRNIQCADNEYVGGIGYESSEFSDLLDGSIGPEVSRIKCCVLP